MRYKPSYARIGSKLERDLRHAPLRELTAEQLSEARQRGFITTRMARAELARRNPSQPTRLPPSNGNRPASVTGVAERGTTSRSAA